MIHKGKISRALKASSIGLLALLGLLGTNFIASHPINNIKADYVKQIDWLTKRQFARDIAQYSNVKITPHYGEAQFGENKIISSSFPYNNNWKPYTTANWPGHYRYDFKEGGYPYRYGQSAELSSVEKDSLDHTFEMADDSHLGVGNLHHVMRVQLPEPHNHQTEVHGKIIVHFHNAARIAGHKVDCFLMLSHIRLYSPANYWWPANTHSIDISKSFGHGIYLNGITRLQAHYEFVDSKTNQPVNIGRNQVIGTNSLDGVATNNATQGFYGYEAGTTTSSTPWWNMEPYKDHYRSNDDTGKFATDENETNTYGYLFQRSPRFYKWHHSNPTRGDATYRSTMLNGQTVTGGKADSFYNNGITDNPNANFWSHTVYFQGNGTNKMDIDFGAGVGYGNFSLSTTMPKIKFKKNYYYCSIGSDRKVHIFHYHNHKTNKISKKKLLTLKLNYTKLGFHKKSKATPYLNNQGYFKNKKALNNWLKNKRCTIPKLKKPHYPKPTPTPIHKSVKNIHPATIDNLPGGRLKQPNQSFDYLLNGNAPDTKVKSNEEYHVNWYQDHNKPIYSTYYLPNQYDVLKAHRSLIGYQWKYYLTWHPDHKDSYNITDKLPDEVRVNKKQFSLDGYNEDRPLIVLYYKNHSKESYYGQVVNDGNHQDVKFNLSYDKLENASNYQAEIPVIANHLPKATTAGWETFWNGGDGKAINPNTTIGKETIYNGNDNSPIPSYLYKPSNHVPVDIKKIQANLYHYAWNPNKLNTADDFFPENEQSVGITNNVNTPTDLNYKNYRYHNFFNNDAVLKHKIHIGYVGSDFGVRMINRNVKGKTIKKYTGKTIEHKDGKTITIRHYKTIPTYNGHYRFVYPSIPVGGSGNNNEPIILDAVHNIAHPIKTRDANNVDGLKLDKHGRVTNYAPHIVPRLTQYEKALSDRTDQWRGATSNSTDGKMLTQFFTHSVPVNMNPDGNGINAYSNTGFSQTNYFPYLVPTVRMNWNTKDINGNPVSNSKLASRLVIDTDQKSHGLPFHLDDLSENDMYDLGDYDRDYDDYVHLNIKDRKTGKSLYSADRPMNAIVGNDNGRLTNSGQHKLTPNEWPAGVSSGNNTPIGNNKLWSGYIDRNVLNNDMKGYKDKADNNDFNLDTRHDRGAKDANQGGIPIEAHFSIRFYTNEGYGLRLQAHNIYTHAYVSERPNINKNKFGHKYTENWTGKASNGKSTVNRSNIAPNTATYILPERTTKYAGNKQVRELKEQMDMRQPRVQMAKAGYGLTAQDIQTDYAGHLNADKYSRKGTSLLTAYPKDFNAKQSNVVDPEDPYGHKFNDTKQYYKQNFENNSTGEDGTKPSDNYMNAAPMLHYNANFKSNNNHDGENNNLPSDLDTFQDNNDAVDADKYWDHIYTEDGMLNGGVLSTTYGYTPKTLTENTSHTSAITGKMITDNGGTVRLMNNNYMNNGASKWDDPTGHKDLKDDDVAQFGDWRYSTEDQDDSKRTDASMLNQNANQDGHNERLFLQMFLQDGIYPMYFESPYLNSSSQASYNHRLGGNFIHIDEQDPLYVYAHMYITRDDGDNVDDYTTNQLGQHIYKDHVPGHPTEPLFNPKAFDELSPQPVLTNPGDSNGKGTLYQVPDSVPAFPKDLWSNNNATKYWVWSSLPTD